METKTADPITVFDGKAHSLKIADGELACFPVVVPAGVARFQLQYFQQGDDTNHTPRTAWVSDAQGYTAEPEKRPPPNGTYPAAQFAYQSPSGNLNCVVSDQPGMHVEMNGSHMEFHVRAGGTLYVTAQNTQQGKNPNDKAQNISVTVKPT